MTLTLRNVAKRALTTLPLYRYVPAPAARNYAALHYHGAHSSGEVCRQAEADPASTLRYFSAAWIGARSAFFEGRDYLAEVLLEGMNQRFPDQAAPHVLRADLDAFRGNHAAALSHVERAQLLDPISDVAAARRVRFAYAVGDGVADRTAQQAVAKFPSSMPVLWAAAKNCHDAEQFERLIITWRGAVKGFQTARPLERSFGPMATAAARAGLIHAAVELYAQAILLRLDGVNAKREVRDKSLAGKGAWSAITDVCEALDGARIPFFFAAGTALGLIREGGPLDHDSDIDVGVFAEHWSQAALLNVFLKHPMFDLDVSHPEHSKIYLRHRRGSSVDVWRFYEEGGRIWHDGLLTRWSNSPFAVQKRRIGKHTLPLPSDPERYLTESYGNWRIPNPDFDAFTEAPNVEATWPEYVDYHRIRRAYRYLTANRARSAVRQLSLAEETLLRTESGRRVAGVLNL